jgi:hypothetical protein
MSTNLYGERTIQMCADQATLRMLQQKRLHEILRRFVNVEDHALSDHEFVVIVHKRYRAAREQPILDPNE